MRPGGGIIERFRVSMAALDFDGPDDAPIVVAVSGGLDSCVLLHLMRFALPDRPGLVVAHLDHGMRSGSAADSDWVAGLCRAWGVPLRAERVERAPTSEDEGRALRYAFLERVYRATGARALMTAHHADDQAETVLFRILRGTGLEGLRGIPRARPPGVVRPLLGFWREELESYAARERIEWRADATNLEHGFARNAIRLRLLPDAEALVAPGARRSLVRLSELAVAEEEAWTEVMARLMPELDAHGHRGPDGEVERVSFDRAATVALGVALRGRVLRWLAREAGVVLDVDTTRRAAAFADAGRSGTAIDLVGGAVLRRSLGRLEVARWPERDAAHRLDEDEVVTIAGGRAGRAALLVGGRSVEVRWAPSLDEPSGSVTDASVDVGAASQGRSVDPSGDRQSFRLAATEFPLQVRGVRPGDRIRLAAGSRKVKKVLLEARIPVEERRRTVVVAGAGGDVVWVPGVARSSGEACGKDVEALTITVTWAKGGADERS